MNYIRRGRRLMAIGCSHGAHISQTAADYVCSFAQDFMPHHRLHLGDAFDTTAFRRGARGTADGASSVDADISAGEAFLRRYQPTVIFMGNHEDRPYNLCGDPCALIQKAAMAMVKELESLCAELHAQMVPYAGTTDPRSWLLFGDTLAGHGFMYNEMATRDHVEMMRGHNVIHAHNHKCGMQPGRVMGAPTGYSVGTLATIPAMAYAKAKRATTAWSGGIVFGEYGDGWSEWQVKQIHCSPPPTFATPDLDKGAE